MNLLPCQNVDKSIVQAKWLKICNKKKTERIMTLLIYMNTLFSGELRNL